MVCIELGVWKGDFSKRIARMSPKELHLVDPWSYQPEYEDRVYGNRSGNDQIKMDRIYCEVCDKFTSWPGVFVHRATSEEAVSLFQDSYFDWIYLDANHSYSFVKRDIESYLSKLKQGGYLTGDDYLYPRCPEGGPKRAIEEAVIRHDLDLITVFNNQFILRRRG